MGNNCCELVPQQVHTSPERVIQEVDRSAKPAPTVANNDYRLASAQQILPYNDILRKVHTFYGEYNWPANTSPEGSCEKLPAHISSDGAVYIGEWKNKKKHGRGTEIWPRGAVYEGEWMQGLACGQGRMVVLPGIVYVGEWWNSQCNGYGEYVNSNPTLEQNRIFDSNDWNRNQAFGAFGEQSKLIGVNRYKGQWKDDEPHGRGMLVRPDKAVYEGEFEYGEINGQGKFKFRDGSWYEGSFQHGIFDGEGTYRFPNGDIYRGTWIRGEKNGKGTLDYAEGHRYVGDFRNDSRDGQGTLTWNDGVRKYIGGWKQGKQHGQAVYISSKGETIRGVWEMGVPQQRRSLQTDMGRVI